MPSFTTFLVFEGRSASERLCNHGGTKKIKIDRSAHHQDLNPFRAGESLLPLNSRKGGRAGLNGRKKERNRGKEKSKQGRTGRKIRPVSKIKNNNLGEEDRYQLTLMVILPELWRNSRGSKTVTRRVEG